MKLERKGTPAQISGAVTGPQSFAIAGSRIAFNILSSGLYSNKIQACIRELSCNAYDAHVAAGKRDVPFEIHLPNTFEPWFTVKDYGTGLRYTKGGCKSCHGKGTVTLKNEDTGETTKDACGKCGGTGDYDAVIALYTTYFASDKNDSNDFIGAMGLGSKSPFCYTEGFTIVNRYQGVTRVYSAYITEQGTPSVVLQTAEDTPDAPNGVEVTFPVNENDCWEFENNARVALEFFNPTPTMVGEKTTVEQPKYVMKTDRWGMRAEANTHQGSGMRAIQGLVAYAVGKIDISKMGPELQALTAMPLDLFFPIGELQVAASREALQLDPNTVANITKALENVYSGLIDEVKKEIDKCKQPWEARLLIFKLIGAPGTGKIVNEALNQGKLFGKYTNFSLNDKKPVVNELDWLHTQIYKFKRNERSGAWATKSSVFGRFTPEHRTLAAAELANGTRKRKDFNREFEVENNIVFVINDIKFGGEKYVHYFLQQATDNKTVLDDATDTVKVQAKSVVYLFSRVNKDHTTAQVMKEAQVMLEQLGNPPVMLMSDLKAKYSQFCDIKVVKPSVPKERRDIVELDMNAQGRKTGRYSYSNSNIPWCNAWKRSESQPDGLKYYVVVEENKATESGFDSAKNFIDFVKDVQVSGKFGLDITTPVYGLKAKSPLRNNTKEWVELTSHVISNVKKVMTRTKQMELTLLLKPCRIYDWDEILAAVAKDKSFPADSPFKKFADSLAVARKAADNGANKALVDVVRIARNRGKYADTDSNLLDFEKGWTELKKMYPMLSLSQRSYYGPGGSTKIVSDYIKMVDAAAVSANAVGASN